MSQVFVLDTHPLLFWLRKPKALSKKALALLSSSANNFLVPTLSLLEIDYLIEIGRVDISAADVMAYLRTNQQFSIVAFDDIVLSHTRGVATRDPFDRVIVATALAHSSRLITRDTWMHEHYGRTVVW